MRKVIFSIVLLILSFIYFPAQAQKSVYYDPPQETYRQAMESFRQQNYGAAVPLFEKYMAENDNPHDAFYENAAYYYTVSNVALGNKNALQEVKRFVTDYPESAWLPKVYFELGKLYFKSRKYTETLDAFSKTSPAKLTKEQKAEYFYKKGYSELSLNRFDEAVASFSQILDSKSNYGPAANFYYGHIQYQKGNYDEALVSFKAIENNRKFNKYVPYYILHIYYERGNYEQVISEGSSYLRKADRKIKGEVNRLIANAYYELGDYENALSYFEDYERMGARNLTPDEHYRIGYTKFRNKQYNAAITNFQKASDAEGGNAQNTWYNLGFCYLHTGQKKFAQNAFFKAYNEGSDPDITEDALYNYVKLTIELGGDMFNDPVAIMKEYIEKNQGAKDIDVAYELLGQLYLASNNYEAALASIEQSGQMSPELQAVYQELAYANAVSEFNKGDYAQAMDNFDKAIRYAADPEVKLKALFWKAEGLYRAKNYKEASALYKDFIAAPGAQNSELYAKAVYNLAYTYFNQKNYWQAITWFKKFMQRKTSDKQLLSDATLRLADSYFILKKFEDASKLYDQVIRNNAKDADYALYQRAFCYGAKGDFNHKISSLTTLTQRYKKSYLYDDALYEIGSTYLIQNDPRHAIIYYDKLVKEKPKSNLAKKSLLKLGFIYYNNNQNDKAIRILKQVVDKYPASAEAGEALSTLQSIYMDKGAIDEYFAYTSKLDFVQVSSGEQDSLVFTSGENQYMNGNYRETISKLESYLQQFPQGGFVLKSYYYLSDCYAKQGDEDNALKYYLKIIDFPDNSYTTLALIKTARVEYDRKEYEMAKNHYQRLADLAEDKGMLVEAQDGTMRCAYFTHDFQKAIAYANLLIDSGMTDDDQLVYAYYIMAKSYQNLGKTEKATNAFKQVEERSASELGAEAKYELCMAAFRKGKPDRSETMIYELSENYAAYPYWVAKGFILLADIYVQRDNTFQAEQTLQSIIDNYDGSDLKQEAQEKLNRIKAQNK